MNVQNFMLLSSAQIQRNKIRKKPIQLIEMNEDQNWMDNQTVKKNTQKKMFAIYNCTLHMN